MLTRELVRAARTRAAVARRPPRPRAPVPKYVRPDVIEDRYATRLRALVAAAARTAYAPLLAALPGLVAAARAERVDGEGGAPEGFRRDATAISASATVRAAELGMRSTLAAKAQPEAARTGADVDGHNRAQLGRQVKAAAGIDLAGSDKLKPIIERFVRDNVALITGLSSRLAREVEALVIDGFARGRLHESLAKDIQQRIGVSESRAQLIAVDQVGKLDGQLNAQRQQDLGVTHFYWRSSEDERVRGKPGGKYPKAIPSHFARNGQRFAYADPPKGKNGEPELPGTPIRCRCTAEPDLEQLRAADAANDNNAEASLAPALDPDVEADALAQLAALEAGAPTVPFDAAAVQRALDEARLAAASTPAASTATAPPPPAGPPGSPPSSGSSETDLAELARRLEPERPAAPAASPDAMAKAAIEAHDDSPQVRNLASSTLETMKRVGDDHKGVNDSYRATLRNADGSTTDALWKPTPVKRLRDNIDPEKEPHRERAASLLAEQLGVRDLYPPATTREIDGQFGSVQLWADGAAKKPSAALDGEAMARMRVFDFIIGNTDRHNGNVLWRGGRPVMIDHGLSFPSGPPGRFVQPHSDSFPTPAGPLRPELLEIIAGIDERAIATTLQLAGLDAAAIKHTLYRVRVLKRDPQRLAASGDRHRDRSRWEGQAKGARHLLSTEERAELDSMVTSGGRQEP